MDSDEFASRLILQPILSSPEDVIDGLPCLGIVKQPDDSSVFVANRKKCCLSCPGMTVNREESGRSGLRGQSGYYG